VTIKLSINSKSCTFTTDVQNVRHLQRRKLHERVNMEKMRTVEELQQRIMEEWERLDQRVIDNAVKQWRKRLRGCVAANDGAQVWHAFSSYLTVLPAHPVFIR